MYKIVAYWTRPKDSDIEAFEKEYWDVHVPLAAKSPEMKDLLLTRIDGGLEGSPAPFYRVAELTWENAKAFERCAASKEWTALREDAGRLIEQFGVELVAGLGTEKSYPVG